jgi:hypothetical protein
MGLNKRAIGFWPHNPSLEATTPIGHPLISMQMTHNALDLTDQIMAHGKALVRAIEALGTIEPTGPFERALARLLIAAYKRRLRAIVKVTPAWVSEEMLSASEHRKAAPLFDFCAELQYTMCV